MNIETTKHTKYTKSHERKTTKYAKYTKNHQYKELPPEMFGAGGMEWPARQMFEPFAYFVYFVVQIFVCFAYFVVEIPV